MLDRVVIGLHPDRDGRLEYLNDLAEHGARRFDLAPNYQNGRCHKLFAEIFSEPSLNIECTTKVGIPARSDLPDLSVRVHEPTLLADDRLFINSIEKSCSSLSHLSNFGILLHNPERLLQFLSLCDALDLICVRLAQLQELYKSGTIKYFGISTWEDHFVTKHAPDLLTLINNHRFHENGLKVYQFPLSLARPGAWLASLRDEYNIFSNLDELNIQVRTLSPLHFGALIGSVGTSVLNGFQASSPAQASLRYINCLGRRDPVCIGCGSTQHYLEARETLSEKEGKFAKFANDINMMFL